MLRSSFQGLQAALRRRAGAGPGGSLRHLAAPGGKGGSGEGAAATASAGRRATGPGRLQRQGADRPAEPQSVEGQVKKHMKALQERSAEAFNAPGKFNKDWRTEQGHKVPYRFRLKAAPMTVKDDKGNPIEGPSEPEPYTDYAGLRFPTLETAENYEYHKDRGLDRVVERAYPITVPGYRRLDPYLREYIHFLHSLDPARFTIDRIAERYRLRRKTVQFVVQEWARNRYLTRSGLTRLRDKHVTREAVVLQKKEEQYAKWVGWDQLGDADDPDTDDEALGEFKGWRSTSDWVKRQTVEVEMMQAFPMAEKRDPMPKRVDVDMVVGSRQHHKIINWIDPTDKVVF